ncbi:flavoprotein [Actinophytocola xanthii]|uniref:Flavoprotein n=1 Tax=Actinophytocola xanthii TaxID=1912961 RepID=A0A1Q8C3J4_9PSEU|nr:flavoprotein [Actinophytocola xanthii]OLF08931.1 flavoprotein [Actinophytocola xanthii]
MAPVLGLVGSAAGGVERLLPELVEPLRQRGWRVAVTLTPTAATWLAATGDIERIEQATGLPVRWKPRLPGEERPHPPVDCHAVVPATSNTVAKLALGLADNQALTQVCEAIGLGTVPVVVFPRINAAHARQPAWESHLAALRGAGVHLLTGDDVWPLHEPRSEPGRDLPWRSIINAVLAAVET